MPEQPAYLHMILGIYATLGVFLLLAARNPIEHLSLIWFTVWSSIVHAVIMAIHSLTDPGQIGHLWGDVAALLLTRRPGRIDPSHGTKAAAALRPPQEGWSQWTSLPDVALPFSPGP